MRTPKEPLDAKDPRQFRVLRDGKSIGVGGPLLARENAVRGDIIQNVETGEKFTWWPELGGHDPAECAFCRLEKDTPKIRRHK